MSPSGRPEKGLSQQRVIRARQGPRPDRPETGSFPATGPGIGDHSGRSSRAGPPGCRGHASRAALILALRKGDDVAVSEHVSSFDRFNRDLTDTILVFGVAMRAFTGVGQTDMAIEVLRALPHGDRLTEDHLQREATAVQREVEADLPHLSRIGVIWLWAMLEVLVENLAVEALTSAPERLTADRFATAKGRIVDLLALPPDEQMRLLIVETLRDRRLDGVGRLMATLALVEIRLELDEVTKRKLKELWAIRNLLVHRAGVADSAFVRACPWLGVEVGQTFPVDRHVFLEAAAATLTVFAALLSATSQTMLDT
jgi:hypothetical protein